MSAVSTATAQALADKAGNWELRVCAPPQSLPYSDIDEPGYENVIAQIVADELGAELTFDWVAFTPDLVNLHFAEGTCDVILGVPDGFEQAATTVAYYQSPYVVVYRADADFDLDSLDDPGLSELEIGVQGAGTPPHAALLKRGLTGNISHIYGDSLMSDNRHAGLVDAVIAGDVDIGFGWGPAIGYWSARSNVDLVVKRVEPQFEPPSIFQSIPMAMGVRRNDLALRDLLTQAIVTRWSDIQQVLEEYDIPLTPTPPPFAGVPLSSNVDVVLRVGVVLPTPTGGRTYDAAVNDIIGEAALQGALLAEGQINSRAVESGTDMVVYYASAPSTDSAKRAAKRIIAMHDVSALVGGVGHGQATAIAEVADAHGLPFFNVGSSEALLRNRCLETTFHVEPAPENYLGALIEMSLVASGFTNGSALRWAVVHLNDEYGHAMATAAAEVISSSGGELLEQFSVEPYTPTYQPVVNDIEQRGADAVLVLLPAAEQLTFMGQYRDFHGAALLTPYPYEVTQTRNFLAANVEYGIETDLPRLMAWETTLADGKAGELNARFTSRWGQPMDGTAWTTFEALMILEQVGKAIQSAEPDSMLAYLSTPGRVFDTSKGSLSFSLTHELEQRIYGVEVVPGAEWGATLSAKLAVARLAGVFNTVSEPSRSCLR